MVGRRVAVGVLAGGDAVVGAGAVSMAGVDVGRGVAVTKGKGVLVGAMACSGVGGEAHAASNATLAAASTSLTLCPFRRCIFHHRCALAEAHQSAGTK